MNHVDVDKAKKDRPKLVPDDELDLVGQMRWRIQMKPENFDEAWLRFSQIKGIPTIECGRWAAEICKTLDTWSHLSMPEELMDALWNPTYEPISKQHRGLRRLAICDAIRRSKDPLGSALWLRLLLDEPLEDPRLPGDIKQAIKWWMMDEMKRGQCDKIVEFLFLTEQIGIGEIPETWLGAKIELPLTPELSEWPSFRLFDESLKQLDGETKKRVVPQISAALFKIFQDVWETQDGDD